MSGWCEEPTGDLVALWGTLWPGRAHYWASHRLKTQHTQIPLSCWGGSLVGLSRCHLPSTPAALIPDKPLIVADCSVSQGPGVLRSPSRAQNEGILQLEIIQHSQWKSFSHVIVASCNQEIFCTMKMFRSQNLLACVSPVSHHKTQIAASEFGSNCHGAADLLTMRERSAGFHAPGSAGLER